MYTQVYADLLNLLDQITIHLFECILYYKQSAPYPLYVIHHGAGIAETKGWDLNSM